MVRIDLDHPADARGALRAISQLVRAAVSPSGVRWQAGDTALQDDLFGAPPHGRDHEGLHWPGADQPVLWPEGFKALAETVALHDDLARFPLLHSLAVKLHADRRAWEDTLDPDRIALERMARQVGREIHKMHAFVRFRPVLDGDDDDARHVAWFEPAHHIVRAAAPFFATRFAAMRWAILTPRGCVAWDRQALSFAPGATRADAPLADEGDALWLTYYRSIFNPARVKVAAMKREMPVRYWKNLPEAQAIPALLAKAPQRAALMVAQSESRAAPVAAAVRAARPPPSSLATCQALAARCTHCGFAQHATQMVWGEGAPDAALMLVGEQPGDREDLEGRPFVGPAGQLLRNTLRELQWPLERLYLTNAVKHFKYTWRGKGRLHKSAAQREAEACAQWLEAEIQAVRPRALVALGAAAARSLLGCEETMASQEGQWFTRGDGIPVLVVRHPAAILRADEARQGALLSLWQDQLRQASGVL